MCVSLGCLVFPNRKHKTVLKLYTRFDGMSLLSIISGKCNHVALKILHFCCKYVYDFIKSCSGVSEFEVQFYLLQYIVCKSNSLSQNVA
jgi:hypothetical protein